MGTSSAGAERLRPTVVHHFCGPVFGEPFRAAAREAAARNGVRLVTVISTKGMRPDGTSRAIVRAVRGLAASMLHGGGSTDLRVPDVNAPSFVRRVGATDAIGIVTGFNQIFGRELIGAFREVVNVHPSILPYYRGPSPTYWCIARGETRTGVTFHRIDERIDAGEILYQEIVAIEGERDPRRLAEAIARRAVPAFTRFLDASIRREPWIPTLVDANAVYRDPMGYGPPPPRE